MQLQAQAHLGDAMEWAAGVAGLDRGVWVEQQGGDGELAVLPEDTDLAQVVGGFAPALQSALEGLNATLVSSPRLRVRLALHYGSLILGDAATFGAAGPAPVVVSRLLDARPLRLHLEARPELDVALIVSDVLYRDVVCSGFCALSPEEFRPVRFKKKGVVFDGSIYDPPMAKMGV
jgi:hypothetical protein